MIDSHSLRHPTTTVVMKSLLWLWLIGLSVLVALGYQTMNDQADQERLDSRLQRLEAQATGTSILPCALVKDAVLASLPYKPSVNCLSLIVAAAVTRLRTFTCDEPLNTTPFWFTTMTVPSPLIAP